MSMKPIEGPPDDATYAYGSSTQVDAVPGHGPTFMVAIYKNAAGETFAGVQWLGDARWFVLDYNPSKP